MIGFVPDRMFQKRPCQTSQHPVYFVFRPYPLYIITSVIDHKTGMLLGELSP